MSEASGKPGHANWMRTRLCPHRLAPLCLLIFVRALPVLGQKPSAGTERAATGKSLTHSLECRVIGTDQFRRTNGYLILVECFDIVRVRAGTVQPKPIAAGSKSSSGNGISLPDEPDVSVLLAHGEIWHHIDLPERTRKALRGRTGQGGRCRCRASATTNIPQSARAIEISGYLELLSMAFPSGNFNPECKSLQFSYSLLPFITPQHTNHRIFTSCAPRKHLLLIVRRNRSGKHHDKICACLDRPACSPIARIAAGTSISAPVLVATVRAEIPASRKRPAR